MDREKQVINHDKEVPDYMTNSKIVNTDERWGGYCPWFLRHDDFSGSGDYLLFFDRFSHRISQLILFNEVAIPNMVHFAYLLESKSFRRFKFDKKKYPSDVASQISNYFSPEKLKSEMSMRLLVDPEEARLRSNARSIGNLQELLKIPEVTKDRLGREEKHYRSLFIDRIGVLEVLLQTLPKQNGFLDFVRDVRSYFAEAHIMLDLDKDTYLIKLLEEPLLQREVLNELLPRLASRFPERAKEISNAYHDMIDGEKKFDDIFIGAFKTLEALAREITNDDSFEFKKGNLQKQFSKLHPTIQDTMLKLAGHRGDEGGHGRDAPEPHEMRYLIFLICNIALLLLDYQQ